MMNLYRRNNSRRRATGWMLSIVCVVVAASIASDMASGGAVRSMLIEATTAPRLAVANVGAALPDTTFFADRQRMTARIDDLEREVRDARVLRIENELLRIENAGLAALVNEADTFSRRTGARVVSAPDISSYGSMTIAAGADDGIAEGDYVVAPGDIAIGTVAHVNAQSALVSLFTAPGNAFDVMVDDGVLAEAVGRGGANARVHVPRDIEVSDGDIVRLPGTPFSVGVVGSVEARPADAEQHVLFRVPLAISGLLFVTIVSP